MIAFNHYGCRNAVSLVNSGRAGVQSTGFTSVTHTDPVRSHNKFEMLFYKLAGISEIRTGLLFW